jgi:hypothetical protein
MKRWTSRAVVVAAFALGAGSASAQQCVGFGDVLASDTLVCPAVEWVKNRGVTLGCGTGANYCPNDTVLRSSMALFMQRLGKALSSEVHKDHVTEFMATIPGESPTPPLLLCAMAGNSTVTPYPRQALLNAAVSGLADGNPVAWRAYWIYSTDGGVTFGPIMDGVNPISSPRASSAASQWSGVALSFALDLPANTPLQVRVVVRRDNVLTGTTGNFADARCQMTVNIVNANGTTSPL